VDEARPFIGNPEDVRRWAENRRIANALEVRDLRTTWNSAERSFWAARALLGLFASINGWPATQDARREREADAVRDRFLTLRRRLRP
jgi:hypothetical protein